MGRARSAACPVYLLYYIRFAGRKGSLGLELACLVKHSGSGHIEAELIDVGPGVGEEAYRGKDVSGKIVLSTGASGGVMREACQKRGAVGVITYFAPDVRPG